MSLTPGSRVGPYEILSSIGAGGMGEVYKARDPKLDRDVAIKVLPASFAEDADRVARFEREAKTLAALNHPHIAQIFGLESPSAGSPQTALVMEFVDGDDLSIRIARGPMPLDEVLPIAKQIADALEAAHDQGIIHRDLKPANVKVRADGTVKVLDFGLAKMADPTGSSSAEMMNSPTLTARGTQMGMIIGTAAYMSPEQAKGRVVDKRADIWAFGVVLFEMLTGKRGYDAEDISDTLAAVLTREVDYSQLPAATPPRLSALLHDCLVRDPKQRLRDMGEARRVLDQLIAGNSGSTIMPSAGTSGVMPAPASPAWRRQLPWAIAGVAVIVAAAATWTALRTPPPSQRVVTRGRSTTKELSAFMSLSRDGAQLVHMVSVGQQGFSLLLRQMDQFEGKPLAGTTGGVFPIFSPGADWVAFSVLENKIKKVPVAGGTSITLCDGTFQNGAAWSDDDSIVFSGAKGLMRVPANGGTPEALTSLDSVKSETQHTRPQFLPGGRQLLFTVTSAAGPQFAVLDLQKRTYQIVGKGGDNGRYVPTGHLIFVRNGTLFATPFDLKTLTATGSETPVIEGVSGVGTPGTGDYTVSDTGVLVYAESLAQNGTLLTWMDRKGVVSQLPGQVHRAWGTGALSPDGRRVANGITADKGADIWVVELSRGTPQRLTFGGENDNPIWAPNGRDLVYAGNVNGKPGLYTVPADGSGQPELVIAGDASMVPSSFTPDGKTLLYSQSVSGNLRVFVLPPAGSDGKRTPHLLRDGAGSDSEARISPDGKWVLLGSTESGRVEVYVLPFPGPGPKTQISTEGGQRARWSASGRELFYWTGAAGNSTLMGVATQPGPTFSAAPPVALFTTFSGTTWGVAPDAQHFLVEAVGDSNGGTTIATVTNWFDELRKRAPAKK